MAFDLTKRCLYNLKPDSRKPHHTVALVRGEDRLSAEGLSGLAHWPSLCREVWSNLIHSYDGQCGDVRVVWSSKETDEQEMRKESHSTRNGMTCTAVLLKRRKAFKGLLRRLT